MKISGAIFDLDGTLLDSMYIWETIGEDYLIAKGITPKATLRDDLKNKSLHQAACYMKERYNIADDTDKMVDDINKMTEDFYINKALLKDGVVDFLNLLKQKDVKMCVATATDRYLAEAALKRNGILNFFGEVFTCREVGHGKDEPHIFQQALEFLSTDIDATWVFEDASHASATAKKAGFKVCGIFDNAENNPNAVRENSDIYIQSFAKAGDYFA